MNKYKSSLLVVVFLTAVFFSVFFSPKDVMAESRSLTAIISTTAYKPDGSRTLSVSRGKTYGVNLVANAGDYWIVDLAGGAGRWKFKKADIDFHMGAYPLTLSNFKGGDRVATIKAIVSECHRFGLLKNQCAYVLATAEHESNFQPIKEAWWMGENWRRQNLRYWPWYGRGYGQMTWDFNYRLYERLTGIKLTKNPDLALQPNLALYILVHGMKSGAFTGYSLENWINSKQTNFYKARMIVNGLDCAGQIAGRASYWYRQLTVY
uniref:Carboxypeptidase n=1 Tax=Gloeothece verrucosa (strain PCC 7822) TaxID=497965 RepID=E0U7T8_GLOV7|nr:hypothetical protein Cyan7822_2943 [Gloeothece verrucosa PCC 7822]